MKTITIEEIRSAKVNTYSVKDDSPRGVKTVSAAAVKVGDMVVINGAFALVVDAPAQPESEQEAEEKAAAQGITTKYYTPSAHISIFLNTWGNYNENGADGGFWVSLPCDIEYMLQHLAKSTGEDADEIEAFINDSETDIDGLEIGELDDIRGLNDLAEQLDELDEWELEQLAAYMEAEGGTLENALENFDDCIFYEGARLIDVAYELADEMLADAPEFCQNYFDYESFARDLGFDGYKETSRGVICTR